MHLNNKIRWQTVLSFLFLSFILIPIYKKKTHDKESESFGILAAKYWNWRLFETCLFVFLGKLLKDWNETN